MKALDAGVVYALADETLSKLITPEMTIREQIRAIYDFTRNTIEFQSTQDTPHEYYKTAYEGFTQRRGDSYTYCAVSQVLFDRLSIPYVQVQRTGTANSHYWSLVNDSQGWYHFDSTPFGKEDDTCMMSASDLQTIAAKRGKTYYQYDPELYPEVMP
jgi:hypothetical protein